MLVLISVSKSIAPPSVALPAISADERVGPRAAADRSRESAQVGAVLNRQRVVAIEHVDRARAADFAGHREHIRAGRERERAVDDQGRAARDGRVWMPFNEPAGAMFSVPRLHVHRHEVRRRRAVDVQRAGAALDQLLEGADRAEIGDAGDVRVQAVEARAAVDRADEVGAVMDEQLSLPAPSVNTPPPVSSVPATIEHVGAVAQIAGREQRSAGGDVHCVVPALPVIRAWVAPLACTVPSTLSAARDIVEGDRRSGQAAVHVQRAAVDARAGAVSCGHRSAWQCRRCSSAGSRSW